MKSLKRIWWELGLEKFFFDLRGRVIPLVYDLSRVRFGFYSGVIFGLALSHFLAIVVFWHSVPDFILDFFGSVAVGLAIVFFTVLSLISHLIRRFFGFSRSCSFLGE